MTSYKKNSCRVSLQCELLNVVSLYTDCSCGTSHHLWDFKCLCKTLDCTNDFSHKEQLKGFSPVWTLMCAFIAPDKEMSSYNRSSCVVSLQCELSNVFLIRQTRKTTLYTGNIHYELLFYVFSGCVVFQKTSRIECYFLPILGCPDPREPSNADTCGSSACIMNVNIFGKDLCRYAEITVCRFC